MRDRGKWSLAAQGASFPTSSQNPLSTVYLNIIWIDVKLPGSCIHISLLAKNVSVYRNNLEQLKWQKETYQFKLSTCSKDSLLKVYLCFTSKG